MKKTRRLENLRQNVECLNVLAELMEHIWSHDHIPISSYSENSQDYFCYKQFHLLNDQAK